MDGLANRLVMVTNTKGKLKASLMAVWENGDWRPPSGKDRRDEPLKAPFPVEASNLWWGAAQDGHIRLLDSAIQFVECPTPKKLRDIAIAGGVVSLGRPGAVVLGLREGTERWFGPLAMAPRDATSLDPFILPPSNGRMDEIVPHGDPIRLGRLQLLPPGWKAGEPVGSLALESDEDFYRVIWDLLQPSVERQLAEIQEWIPGVLSRLNLDAQTNHNLPGALTEALLGLPILARSHKKKLDEERQSHKRLLEREKQAIEEDVRLLKRERDQLAAVTSKLRERKREEILLALSDVVEDDRALALVATLGLKTPAPVKIDLSGVEKEIAALAARSVAEPTDLAPIVEAISQRPVPDFEPLAEAIKNSRIEAPLQVQKWKSPVLEQTGDVVSDEEDVDETFRDDVSRSLLILAQARRAGLVIGRRAPETVQAFLRLAVAGRAVWWPVPTDLMDVRQILEDDAVRVLLDQCIQQPNRLFGLVLEGVNRAPTETYLEALLVIRDLGIPFPGSSTGWPDNLILVGTVLREGPTLLPIAAGVWDRAIPIPAAFIRAKRPSEIALSMWTRGPSVPRPIDLAGLIPKDVPVPDISGLEEAAGNYGLNAPKPLVHGVAAAACLSGGGPNPIEAIRETFPSLFA